MSTKSVVVLLFASIAAILRIASPPGSGAADQPRGITSRSSPSEIEAVSYGLPAPRIDFGVTSDDFGVVASCLSIVPVNTQFVFTRSIVFGSAVEFAGVPTGGVIIVADGACSPSCRSSGSPPYFTDWWCQFKTGSAPGVPDHAASVNYFSAELCLIDEPYNLVTLMVAYDIDGNVIDTAAPVDGPTVQVLTVQDPLSEKRIGFIQVLASVDLSGLTVDYLDYDDPAPVGTGIVGVPFCGNYLGDIYPNPCNPYATINYGLENSTHVYLAIYDARGRLVRTLVNEEKAASPSGHSVVWDGRDDEGKRVSSGVYFCGVRAGQFSQTRKIVVLK